jgi:hypothetical protein
MSTLEGALLMARVLRSREPLLAAGRALRAMATAFLTPPAPATRRPARRARRDR